ncbi:MAG TPA: DUF2334 domain-containing protein [Solirubrobacteraceae bacterium]
MRAVPPPPVRVGEQLIYKFGRRYCERTLADRQLAGWVVGGDADTTAPRILVRVDEFPHYQAWDKPDRFGVSRFERFHEIMTGASVPYLLAVPPRVSREPLSPTGTDSRPLDGKEVAVLRRLAGERVCLALHGHDHRTRFASPRRHSELCGLDRAQTESLIDEALADLVPYGIKPNVFVPPFNRFDARQFGWLAERFAVVCGGPESIGLMGFQRTPQWREEAVYLPSYAPFYGRAAEILRALPRAIERTGGLWMPIVLHWGWEADAGWGDLERLARLIAPYASQWEDFLAAVELGRGTPSASVVSEVAR